MNRTLAAIKRFIGCIRCSLRNYIAPLQAYQCTHRLISLDVRNNLDIHLSYHIKSCCHFYALSISCLASVYHSHWTSSRPQHLAADCELKC